MATAPIDIASRGAWIQTYSGRQFYPLAPRAEDIEIIDIAWSLSMQCRFNGMSLRFYSVAEHSVRVARACDPADALCGLLHDAAEAYCCDVPAPIKRLPFMRAYRDAEARIQLAICERFGLPFEEPESVGVTDARLLATEARDLMASPPADWGLRAEPLEEVITPVDQAAAAALFLREFYDLGGRWQ